MKYIIEFSNANKYGLDKLIDELNTVADGGGWKREGVAATMLIDAFDRGGHLPTEQAHRLSDELCEHVKEFLKRAGVEVWTDDEER